LIKLSPPSPAGAVDITVEATSAVTYLAWRFDVLYEFIRKVRGEKKDGMMRSAREEEEEELLHH
jgi:hypothetical protein